MIHIDVFMAMTGKYYEFACDPDAPVGLLCRQMTESVLEMEHMQAGEGQSHSEENRGRSQEDWSHSEEDRGRLEEDWSCSEENRSLSQEDLRMYSIDLQKQLSAGKSLSEQGIRGGSRMIVLHGE